MSPFAECLVLGILSGFLVSTVPVVDEPSAYLVGGNGPKRLKDRVVLREQQGGFAGDTGKIRTIEPDGSWRIEEFITEDGKEQVKTMRTGRLSEAALEALAKSFATHDFRSLPEKVGEEEPVNPHKVTISFGKRRTTLSGISPRLDADETIKSLISKTATDRGLAADKIWSRCADLAHSIESSIATSKK
jgi:hypothetical protein